MPPKPDDKVRRRAGATGVAPARPRSAKPTRATSHSTPKTSGGNDADALRLSRLRRFNVGLAGLHGAQGVAVLLASSSFALPVMSSFLRVTNDKLVPHPRTLFALRIGPLVACFFFLSAVAHLTVALPGVFDRYARNLKRGINYARWIEYSVSASLMIVVIAMLVGIYDVVALIGLFGLNAAMILFGLMMELHNQDTKQTNWTAFSLGSILGALPWLGIGIYLFATSGVPTFVYWIYASIFVFFNCFAVNMVMQYRKIGPWRDYLYGERSYVILSLVAKSLLAWQVFAGTLRPM